MKKIKRFLMGIFHPPAKTPERITSPDPAPKIENMLGMIARTQEVELTCDEVYELIDQFAEMAQRGENVAELMPLVQQHLDMCPDCREEYEALKRVLDQDGISSRSV